MGPVLGRIRIIYRSLTNNIRYMYCDGLQQSSHLTLDVGMTLVCNIDVLTLVSTLVSDVDV